ncbi:hypothetical protein V8C26DRAFT_366868 [Trichoderma gracile]
MCSYIVGGDFLAMLAINMGCSQAEVEMPGDKPPLLCILSYYRNSRRYFSNPSLSGHTKTNYRWAKLFLPTSRSNSKREPDFSFFLHSPHYCKKTGNGICLLSRVSKGMTEPLLWVKCHRTRHRAMSKPWISKGRLILMLSLRVHAARHRMKGMRRGWHSEHTAPPLSEPPSSPKPTGRTKLPASTSHSSGAWQLDAKAALFSHFLCKRRWTEGVHVCRSVMTRTAT